MRGPVAACVLVAAVLIGGAGWSQIAAVGDPGGRAALAANAQHTVPTHPGASEGSAAAGGSGEAGATGSGAPGAPGAPGVPRAGGGTPSPTGGTGSGGGGGDPATGGSSPATGSTGQTPDSDPVGLPASLACWGDSLTYGSGSEGDSYPEDLADLSGLAVYNGGVPGERSAAIAGRQGGRPPATTVEGGSIPAAGPVAVSFELGLAMLKHGGWLTGSLAGVHGTLRGTPFEGYTFTRTTPGAPTTVPVGSPFVSDIGVTMRTAGTIIWAGHNDVAIGYSFQVLDSIADMVAYVQPPGRYLEPPGRYLVLSLLNGTGSELGTPAYDEVVRTLNPALAEAYGPDHYLDIRSWLITDGLAAAGLTPTAQDRADIANDVPPSSLRELTSAGHLNATGYRVVAQRIYDYISARGWVP